MKIRDAHALLSGDSTEQIFQSGSIEIVAEDGRALLRVTMGKDGTVRVHAGMVCKHGGKLLDDAINIRPISSNAVEISRPEYK